MELWSTPKKKLGSESTVIFFTQSSSQPLSQSIQTPGSTKTGRRAFGSLFLHYVRPSAHTKCPADMKIAWEYYLSLTKGRRKKGKSEIYNLACLIFSNGRNQNDYLDRKKYEIHFQNHKWGQWKKIRSQSIMHACIFDQKENTSRQKKCLPSQRILVNNRLPFFVCFLFSKKK